MAYNTIQTEVDALVSLINDSGSISAKDAAKRLNVSVQTIMEWASLLDEEGIIKIEYKFTTPYLVKKKISEEQLANVKEYICDEKDILKRKSESALNYLNRLETEVTSLKDVLEDISKNFQSKMASVNNELKDLKNAESEKEMLDKQIIESKQNMIKRIADLNKTLNQEEQESETLYNLLYTQSDMERALLNIDEEELKLIQTTDKLLDKKLKDIQGEIKKHSKLNDKSKKSVQTESHLRELEKKYSDLKEKMDNEKNVVEDLIERNKKQEEYIDSIKKDTIMKIEKVDKDLGKKISETKELPKRLKVLMEKKDKVMQILNGVLYNEKILKEKLAVLIKKSENVNKGYDENIAKELKELEESLREISNKRGFFETKIKDVFKMLNIGN